MHIAEGVLSNPVLIGSTCVAIIGTAIGLKKTKAENIPKTAIFASAFFVASLVHVPLGGASAHLILNGLLGIFLGWSAIPAILTALILQSILFQFGGLTALGANTVVMAGPAIICYYLFRRSILSKDCKKNCNIKQDEKCICIKTKYTYISAISAFLCGAVATILSAILLAYFLMLSGEEFKPVAWLILTVHIPVMIVEAIVTCACISFVKKVKPEILYMEK